MEYFSKEIKMLKFSDESVIRIIRINYGFNSETNNIRQRYTDVYLQSSTHNIKLT